MLPAGRSGPSVIAWWRPPPAPSPRPCSPVSSRSPPSASPSTSRTPRSPPPSTTSGFRSSAAVPIENMAEALIALGGNVGEENRVRATLDRAIDVLCDGEDIQLLARSSDYRTPPVGVTAQPPFINCAIIVTTELIPPALLDRAQEVERQFGRDRARERRWGPRTLD